MPKLLKTLAVYLFGYTVSASMISASSVRERWAPVSPEEQFEVMQALEEVLASPYFCNSKRYPAVLQYLVKQTLLGRGDEIKERTVGIDVFGRRPDYDTNLDTSVRYATGEVRKRLSLYYHAIDAPIQINLTARSYCPEFLRRVDVIPTTESKEDVETCVPLLVQDPVVKTEVPIPRRQNFTWIISAIAVLLLFLIGIRFWNNRHTSAEHRFWAPILAQKIPIVISLGGIPVSLHSSHATEVGVDDGSGNPYMSFETGLAMERIVGLLKVYGGSYRVQPATTTTIAQMQENPTVLIGAYNNEWTLRLTESLRFHFAALPDKRIVDAKDPSRSWARDRSKPFGDTPDYAIVARFHEPSTDSTVIAIAGLQRFGTDAASQFVTSTDLLEHFDQQIGRNWRDKNIEVVLRVDVMKGRTAAPTVVATDVW